MIVKKTNRRAEAVQEAENTQRLIPLINTESRPIQRPVTWESLRELTA